MCTVNSSASTSTASKRNARHWYNNTCLAPGAINRHKEFRLVIQLEILSMQFVPTNILLIFKGIQMLIYAHILKIKHFIFKEATHIFLCSFYFKPFFVLHLAWQRGSTKTAKCLQSHQSLEQLRHFSAGGHFEQRCYSRCSSLTLCCSNNSAGPMHAHRHHPQVHNFNYS